MTNCLGIVLIYNIYLTIYFIHSIKILMYKDVEWGNGLPNINGASEIILILILNLTYCVYMHGPRE